MSDGNGNGGGRSTDAILADALDELHTRRERLTPFVDELRKIDHAIKVIEKATDGPTTRATPKRKAASGPSDLRARVIAALEASLDPLTAGTLAELLNETGQGVAACLRHAKDAGLVVHTDDGWGLPVHIDTEDSTGALAER